MLKKIYYCLLSFLLGSFTPLSVHAQTQTSDTVTVVTSNTNYTFLTNLKPSAFSATIINVLLGVAGVASFVFLLWGGVQWITAGGDKDGIDKARKKIMGALIGLIIVFSAFAILFVLRTLFNVNIIGFGINPLSNL